MMPMDELVAYLVREVKLRLSLPSAYIFESEDSDLVLEKLESLKNIHFYQVGSPHDADILIVPRASARFMAEISQGYGELEQSKVLIHHLASGKKAWCIEAGIVYRKYEKTCPEKLFSKWLAYEKEAQNMGLKIVDLSQFEAPTIETIKAIDKSVMAISNEVVYEISQKLITEKVIMASGAKPESTVKIGNSAIVTPLAQDYLRQARLKIKRQEME